MMNPAAIADTGFQMTFVAVTVVAGVGVPAVNWAFGWLTEALIQFDDTERNGRLSPDIADGVPEIVDMYKVPHHGSTGVKLQVLAPIRVISVGANNPFGHRDPSLLPALGTDPLGAISVTLADRPVIGSSLTPTGRWYKLASLLQGH